MPDDRFIRIENKIDRLTETVSRLIVIEERQTNQASRMSYLDACAERHEARLTALEHQQIMWQNRAIGIVLCVGVVWQAVVHLISK